MYLEYNEYLTIGGILDSAAFNRQIVRACNLIDAETHNRVQAMANVPDSVKALCRDLIEYFAKTTEDKTVTSRSQSVGNVSESESYANVTESDKAIEIENIFYDYLMSETDDKGTPLLYRGGLI